jgi:hypothetical protein
MQEVQAQGDAAHSSWNDEDEGAGSRKPGAASGDEFEAQSVQVARRWPALTSLTAWWRPLALVR